MSRCTDPTCWRIAHERADHLTPGKRIRQFLGLHPATRVGDDAEGSSPRPTSRRLLRSPVDVANARAG